MDSSHLEHLGFEGWKSISLDDLGSPRRLLSWLPQRPGIYALRTARFGRFEGESDVAYIGRATDSVRFRFSKHLHPGHSGRPSTSYRIHEVLWEVAVEVGWMELSSPMDVLHVESFLRGQYEEEHRELPPLNRRGVEEAYLAKARSYPRFDPNWIGALYRSYDPDSRPPLS